MRITKQHKSSSRVHSPSRTFTFTTTNSEKGSESRERETGEAEAKPIPFKTWREKHTQAHTTEAE